MLPPPYIYKYDKRDIQVLKRASIRNLYIFYYGELSRSNIIVHPITLKVVAIVDQENIGFYPTRIKRPLQKLTYLEYIATYKDYTMLNKDIAAIIGQDNTSRLVSRVRIRRRCLNLGQLHFLVVLIQEFIFVRRH